MVEGCVGFEVGRLVNLSSETVPGIALAERPFEPANFPIDEDHPVEYRSPGYLDENGQLLPR